MRSSGEERREVVSFLRNNCVLDDYAQTLGDIAGYEYPIDTFDAAGYLADLVDRPTCRMSCDEKGVGLKGYTCSRCGEASPNSREPHYCPNCGAEVVS